MTPQMVRLLGGFLAAYVLLSALPQLPDVAVAVAHRGLPEVTGDLLFWFAAGVALPAAAIALRRRLAARGRRSAPAAPKGTDVGARIRRAAMGGARIPHLARQFRTSQDAVRAAIGRDGTASSAAEAGNSCRSRHAALPAPSRRAPVPARRTPYRGRA